MAVSPCQGELQPQGQAVGMRLWEPRFQQHSELSQHLNHSGGPGCMGEVEPHSPRSGIRSCGGANLREENPSGSQQGEEEEEAVWDVTLVRGHAEMQSIPPTQV